MNRTTVLALSLVVLLFVGIGAHAAPPTDSGHLVVLMYHRFDAGGSISIPMEQFKRQVDYLKSNNYQFLSLPEVRRHLRQSEPFPDRAVLLTIDDGYKSTFTHAYPYLKNKGIPWVLYVYTEAIDRGFSSALSWEQIREMAHDGVTVGNHTYSHDRPVSEAFRSGDWVNREIIEPQKRLENQLDTDVVSFAIPYGEYDTELIEVLSERGGYEVVWGIDPGVVDPREDRYVLPRFGVNGSTSMEEFKKKLRRLPLSVRSLEPEAGTPIVKGDTLAVTLENPGRYHQGPINVFFSELGAMKWSWSEDNTTVRVPVTQSLSTSWNRLIITAYDGEYGRYRYFSKGFPTAAD